MIQNIRDAWSRVFFSLLALVISSEFSSSVHWQECDEIAATLHPVASNLTVMHAGSPAEGGMEASLTANARGIDPKELDQHRNPIERAVLSKQAAQSAICAIAGIDRISAHLP